MTQDETYRARAQTVRLAARAHLLEMRRTRLAKRAGPEAPPPAPGDLSDDPVAQEAAAAEADDVAEAQAADAAPVAEDVAEPVADPSAEADAPAQIAMPEADPPPPAAVEPPPKPKRKAAAPKPAPKRAVKPPEPAAPPGAVFVPKPRSSPLVFSRPAQVVPVADPDDLSILAAAMSEIEEDLTTDIPHRPEPPVASAVAVMPDTALDEVEPELPEDPDLALEAVEEAPQDEPEPVAEGVPDPEPVSGVVVSLASEPEADGALAPECGPEPEPIDVALREPEPKEEAESEDTSFAKEDAAAPDAEADLAPVSEDSPDPEESEPEPVDADEVPVAAAAVMQAEPAVPVQIEPALEVAAPEGLYALPGAGPGLVWMLGQVGIDSMGDLARADADDLGRKLGLVGQILNVGSWVAYAKSAEGRSASH